LPLLISLESYVNFLDLIPCVSHLLKQDFKLFNE